MLPKHQILIAALAGAVIGFALVWLAITGSALILAPVIMIPAVRDNWRTIEVMRDNATEAIEFLDEFWAIPQPEPLPARFQQAPRIVASRMREHHLAATVPDLLRRQCAWAA